MEWYEAIRKFRRYDPETGLWYRGDKCLNHGRVHRFQMMVAGLLKPSSHWAWLYMTGEWPTEGLVIDHIDRDPANDKWSNLRLVTQSENRRNSGYTHPRLQVDISRFGNSVPVWGARLPHKNTMREGLHHDGRCGLILLPGPLRSPALIPTILEDKKMSEVETGAIADVLAEAQEAVQDVSPKKRERKPKLDADGNEIVKAPKAPKEPKQYPVWNEDGTQATDADGNLLFSTERTKKPKAPKQPRLDADGNPIVRRSNVFLDEQIIRRTEKAAEFKARPDSKRGQMFAAAEDGKTVGQFYAEMGGKAAAHTFLVWFVNEAEVLTIE